MFRNDRFESEVKRIGKQKVLEELFKGGSESKINHYYEDGVNIRLDKLEAFCKYFSRPVDFFIDLSDGKSTSYESDRFVSESSNYLEEAGLKLAHAKEKIILLEKIIESKNEIITILSEENKRLRESKKD